MAEMEAIKQAEEEEDEDEDEDEDDDENGGKEKDVVLVEVSLKVNEDVTLYPPELCIIYNCLHVAWKFEDTRWNDAEIKQIIGHSMLELDDVKYDHLNLGNAIERLRNQNNDLTRGVKVLAEKLKDRWVDWIPQLHAKYSNMCRKYENLAKCRDDELRAQRIAQTIAGRIQCEERQISRNYPSINTVLGESSSESQGRDGRQEEPHGER